MTLERFYDPQQFNLNAYTRNNPLRFIDPTGKTLTISGDLDELKKQLAEMLGTDDAAKRIKFDAKTNTITVDLTGIDLNKNEGAALLNDVISSNKVYDVKIGTSVDTKGGEISLVPQLKNGRVQNDLIANLDNNPDVRYTKGDKDRPKNDVDDHIAFNYDWRDKHSESNTKLSLPGIGQPRSTSLLKRMPRLMAACNMHKHTKKLSTGKPNSESNAHT